MDIFRRNLRCIIPTQSTRRDHVKMHTQNPQSFVQGEDSPCRRARRQHADRTRRTLRGAPEPGPGRSSLWRAPRRRSSEAATFRTNATGRSRRSTRRSGSCRWRRVFYRRCSITHDKEPAQMRGIRIAISRVVCLIRPMGLGAIYPKRRTRLRGKGTRFTPTCLET